MFNELCIKLLGEKFTEQSCTSFAVDKDKRVFRFASLELVA